MSGAERLNGKHRPPPPPPGSPPASPPAQPPTQSISPGAKPASPRPLTPDALAGGMYAKRGELTSLARRHGLTLDELARKANEPESSRSIASLRRLAEARAGVLLARARADATSLLLALAQSAESDETRRRACVDLLKAPSHPTDETSAQTEEGIAPDDGAGESILGLLERLGEASRERVAAKETSE